MSSVPAPASWKSRAAILFVALVLGAMAVHQWTVGNTFITILPLAAIAGLLRSVRWGRRLAAVLMWLLLLFAIGNVLPARIEVDEALGLAPATPAELWTQLAVMAGAALASLHILGVQKARFRAAWW